MLRAAVALLISFAALAAAPVWAGAGEKVYVVERGRSAIAVVQEGRPVKTMSGFGKLHHATVKFHDGYAFVIGRDGFVSKIDTTTDEIVSRVSVGKSSIGLTFLDGKLAVANYDPGDVVILSTDLEVLERIETGSRNVGIKTSGRYLVFSLMDKDEIWVMDMETREVVERVEDAGQMPFDALVSGDVYIAGFFKEKAVGMLDLGEMSYRRVEITGGGSGGEVVMKVPHFGTWGILEGEAFVPAVGRPSIDVLDLEDLGQSGEIALTGLPVFAVVSPDRRFAAVNYSGDRENFLTIVDLEKRKAVTDMEVGRRIMHMRFSPDSERLFVSSYFDNKVKVLKAGSWEVAAEYEVPSPSGIFIVPSKKGGES